MFLRSAAFRPRYVPSRGSVTIPTEVRVQIKTVICINPAPLRRRSAAIGKAITTGTSVKEPSSDDIIIPEKPDALPIIFCIVFSLTTAIIALTINRMAKNFGITERNILSAFFSDALVLSLSAFSDAKIKNTEIMYIVYVNVLFKFLTRYLFYRVYYYCRYNNVYNFLSP